MKNLTLIKELHGHSGCNLWLYKSGNEIFLRKDAGTVSYNDRLKEQCLKQQNFKSKTLKTPQVLNHGIDKNGLFFFDMEYINGTSLAEYMNKIKIKEIVKFTDILFDSFSISSGKQNPQAHNIFNKKLESLGKTCDIKNPSVSNALNILKQFDFSSVPESKCCGDLTLENIMLTTSDIYVIDLLDSFYNSWTIDVAKLLQDVDVGWSYRHQKRTPALDLRLATTKQALIDRLEMLDNGKQYIDMIYHILLLNILRIYPYTKDNVTFDFLNNATEKIIQKIKSKEY